MADMFVDQDKYPKFKGLSKDFLKNLTAGELAYLFDTFSVYKYTRTATPDLNFLRVTKGISVGDLRFYLNDMPDIFLIILETEADEQALEGGLK